MDITQLNTGQEFVEAFNSLHSITTAGSSSINWSISARQKITITANTTFTFSNMEVGVIYHLFITNGGNYTVTFPTIRWKGATAPQLATSGTDVISVISDGTNVYGDYSLDFA